MKNDDFDISAFIEKRLDQISSMGEWVGKNLGGFGRTSKNMIIAAGVLIVFGVAAFLWALGKGFLKKDK